MDMVKKNCFCLLLTVLLFFLCFLNVGCEKPIENKTADVNEVLNKLNMTVNISISKQDTGTVLGTISDLYTISKIVDLISNSILESSIDKNSFFLCDGHGINLEMYDESNNLIDTIYVWTINERLIPASLHSGCAYYPVLEGRSIKELIEQAIDYKFYILMSSSETCAHELELLYEDEKYSYYLDCENWGNVEIKFETSGVQKGLKEALNNKDIKIDDLLELYPDIVIKKEK